MVRMLCSRSATLITSTRGSRAIAMIILRMVSRLGGVAEIDLVELGDAVDEVGDLVAELVGQLLERVAGVFDGVVQQRRDQRGRVHAQFGEDVRDGERMRDVRVAGLAELAGVPLLGDVVGALQQREIRLRIQLAVQADERFENRPDGRVPLTRDAPGESRSYPARCGRRNGESLCSTVVTGSRVRCR